MTEKLNYISDDELEQLIAQVEQEELVSAPPDLTESILETVKMADAARKKEFRAYCIRVITSVAAAVALVFLLPELTNRMNLSGMPVTENVAKSDVIGTAPERSDVVKSTPDRATVVGAKSTPMKEEVLDDTGFIEKVISGTAEWLSKKNKEQ